MKTIKAIKYKLTIKYKKIKKNIPHVAFSYVTKFLYLPSKHKEIVTTLSKRQTIGCINVVSSLERKDLLMSVDNVVAPLRSNVVATLWQRSANIVTTSEAGSVQCIFLKLRQLHFGKIFCTPWKTTFMGRMNT